MDLTKSRKSKNVIDARRLSREIDLNNRSMASSKLKSKTPLKKQSGDLDDAIAGWINNPGKQKGLPKKRKDPPPQKIKQAKAAKSGRAGPTRPQRKNRNYEGPK